jgi:two-component system, LytTR family, sensor kinase
MDMATQIKNRNLSQWRKKWVGISMHILIWLIVFLIPYIFSANLEGGHQQDDADRRQFLYLNTGMTCFWVMVFYFNAGVLFPQLVYKRKIGVYILALAGLLCIVVLLDRFFFFLFIDHRVFSIFHSIGQNFIPFLFTLAVSAAYKAISDKTKDDLLVREKQSENLKTELSFLRSQISPHFLFNVLNNIVALVRIKSNELEPTVLKLSSLMHYMLYETDEEKVVLKSEVEYLKNYLDLQKQRFGPELSLKLDFDVQEDWHIIEPMLLIPFVENAFKHGNGQLTHPDLEIHLKVNASQLDFIVKNRFEESTSIKDKTPGIGLLNVKRRLELLYPRKHKLIIDKNGSWFTINLHLTLQ